MTAPTAAPLSGTRVLDLTQFLAGPFATQILADLGAEVIKVESPHGDLTRRLPPYFIDGDSAYYHSVNRSKRGIVVDFKTTAGQDLLRRLVAISDVVIENFRPGTLGRYGLGYDELRAENPRLVMCSISGYGQTGPYRDRPAYDAVVQAVSGGMSITGELGRPPVRMGIPIADLTAGLYAASAIAAALHGRQRTGAGEYIDLSMTDCQLAMLSYQAAYHLESGVVPGPQGSGHDSIPTYRSFRCADGAEVIVTANTEQMWVRLCEALGLARLLGDERYADHESRYTHRFSLWEELEAGFLRDTSHVWIERLLAAGVPCGRVNSIADALTDPQAVHRGMVMELPHPRGRPVRVAGNPIRLRHGVPAPPRVAPPLGADTESVLADLLGLAADEISQLLDTGVAAQTGRRSRMDQEGGQR